MKLSPAASVVDSRCAATPTQCSRPRWAASSYYLGLWWSGGLMMMMVDDGWWWLMVHGLMMDKWINCGEIVDKWWWKGLQALHESYFEDLSILSMGELFCNPIWTGKSWEAETKVWNSANPLQDFTGFYGKPTEQRCFSTKWLWLKVATMWCHSPSRTFLSGPWAHVDRVIPGSSCGWREDLKERFFSIWFSCRFLKHLMFGIQRLGFDSFPANKSRHQGPLRHPHDIHFHAETLQRLGKDLYSPWFILKSSGCEFGLGKFQSSQLDLVFVCCSFVLSHFASY